MKTGQNEPPAIFLRFFRWFCDPSVKDYIEGDILELYDERAKTLGKRRADTKFIIDVLLLFRPGIIKIFNENQSVNNSAMFKSYIKIAWRNLLRSKGYSFINIGGLATGMAVAMLVGLWIYDELSFDKNFPNHDRIARVMQNQTIDGAIQTWFSQAMQLGPELRDSYGDNFEYVVIGTFPDAHKLAYAEEKISKSGSFMEPGVSEMLSLKMLKGTRNGLENANAILLSQSTAQAIFGDEDPLDKIIKADDRFDVKVVGVYEDLPDNSSFSNLQMILSWELIAPELQQRTGWGNSWFQCFVQLKERADFKTVSASIKDIKLKKAVQNNDDAVFKPELFLHPMEDWRLYSDFKNGVSVGGEIQYVWMLGVIGSFVLLLACINFMNLSTARSEKRAKEVGIRKTIGSVRTQFINQFFTESVMIAVIAFLFALVLVQLGLPWFNEVSGKNMSIAWNNPWFWGATTGFAFFTGLLAGSYPALFLSSFQPVKVLKGTYKAGRFSAAPRKVMVVIQFTVSVTLIIGTTIIFRQIEYARSRPIGYALNGIISVPITGDIMKQYDVLRSELLSSGVVEEMAASQTPVTETFTTNSGFEWNGKDPEIADEFVTVGITHDFGKTIGWEITDGKDFSRDLASDSSGFIINEAAAIYMGLANPVGEVMKWGKNGDWKIIGVIKNMVTQSPYSSVKPTLFFLRSNRIAFIQYTTFNIKINPATNPSQALEKIERVFKKFNSQNEFAYKFADQEFGKKFNNEKRIGSLAFACTILAIFISCLGLFGLASFLAEQRTKEISIRKILGASVSQVWKLLSRDFAVLVIIACALSIPLSFYFMEKWLKQYEYRMVISWEIFLFATLGATLLTLLTVSFQSIRAALNNPVKSLRSE